MLIDNQRVVYIRLPSFADIKVHVYIADKVNGPWTHKRINGDIYDLSVLFDDDGKIYAIHKYGNVTCT